VPFVTTPAEDARGPLQHILVTSSCKGSVLYPDQIQGGENPQQSADDPAIEVLIGGQSQHQVAPALALPLDFSSSTSKFS
jgi:hypothetical protein